MTSGARRKAHAHGTGSLTFVGSTEEIRIGAVVVDRYSDLPGTVQNIDGRYVRVERPSGRVWEFYYRRLRPATDYEKHQLTALDRLHRQQRRGPA